MLKSIKLIKYNVLSDFLERKTPIPVYHTLVNTHSGVCVQTDNRLEPNKHVYILSDFPSYLKAAILTNGWKSKTINTYKGSLILLKNYNSTQSYLKAKFNTPKRFRIYKEKLETCFNIEYKTYCGHITRVEYDYLFDTFKAMLQRRFLEKKIENQDLAHWENYQSMAYPLINNKQAVLFVIYNNREPISFYLNLINNNTIYGYVKTYDVDYSKFSIGFISFLQQLQWSLDNHMAVYDLLKGNYEYKNKLSDTTFFYQKRVLYNSKSLLTVVIAQAIILKIQAFYSVVKFLKYLKIDVLYHNILNRMYEKRLDDFFPKTKIQNNYKITTHESLVAIKLQDASVPFLRRAVYTFMYHNKESLNKIAIFKYKNEKNTFIIKGAHQIQKITFQ